VRIPAAFVLAVPLWLLPLSARGQTRALSGTVLDSVTSRPLAGASVMVKDTRLAVSVREDGRFSLPNAPDTQVILLVRMIGYRKQEITLHPGEGPITVRLAPDPFHLEEIVATGQATGIERRYAANAVSTVRASDLEDVPAASVEQLLYGKVAGADIQKNSGAPGGGLQVRLRGITSLNTPATPLYVVDGMIVSDIAIPSGLSNLTASGGGDQDDPVNRIVDLNPDDIETIEILKGASASAIYGSKASNGVVLITTKHGRAGVTRVTITQRLGFSELSNTLGSRVFHSAAEAGSAFGEQGESLFVSGVTFDNERALAGRRALGYETAVSASGGTDRTRYFGSGMLHNEPGIIANTGFEKQSLRLNLDQRLGERVSLGLSTNLIHTLAQRGLTNNDNNFTSFYMVLPSTPSFVDLRRRPDGTWPRNPFAPTNPLQTAALMKNDESVWRFLTAGQLSVRLLGTARSSVRLTVNGGADFFNQANSISFPAELPPPIQDKGFETRGNNLNLNLGGNLVHTYTTPGERVIASTSLGIQHERSALDVTRLARDGASAREPSQQRAKTRDLGFFLQEEVLLDRRLLLTLGTRADQSSRNGRPSHLFFYPKTAASFRLMEGDRHGNSVKLRAAYGEAGNQPRYGQKFTRLVDAGDLGGQPGTSVSGRTAARDLRPEHQREIESGVDAELFSGTAMLEFTAFQKNVTDLIVDHPLATSTGFEIDTRNQGSLRTRGLEASLALSPVRRDHASWLTRVMFALTRTKVTSLPVPIVTQLGNQVIEEGRSPSVFLVPDTLPDGSAITRRVEANPSLRASLSNDLRFRRFRLSFLLDWQQGGRILNITKFLYDFAQTTTDYTEPIPGSDLTRGQQRLFAQIGAPYLESASFLKLREVTFAYELPERVAQGIWSGVHRAQVSLSARNLVTITGYSGLDPEVSNFGDQPVSRLWDIAPFPPSRSFWLTVELGL
jgi:TonB-linked SusC/RagA family outer membrane protein